MMFNGQDWFERASDYYFKFRWWKYLLVFIVGFVVGHFGDIPWQKQSAAFTVTSPDECKQFNLKPTGWEFQALYKGGINQGGASSFIAYECK